jgi:hypothetical protein
MNTFTMGPEHSAAIAHYELRRGKDRFSIGFR